MNISDARLPERICAWYALHRRILPWRTEKDPYKIWVSEIMLQQTRVEAVRPYYARFLQELPDIVSLAACPENRLLKLWEGLGYYSRVRHMQEAARILVQEAAQDPDPAEADAVGIAQKAPALPADTRALLALPGIGSYTAGAIASIAFGVRVPAVDGNVLRILARLTGDARDVRKDAVKREAEQALTALLQTCDTPGEFNQGMMDLGAGICLPNAQPHCEACPLADLCTAHRTGKETELPYRSALQKRRIEQRTVLVIRDGTRVVLTRRPEKGLLAGMYEFPNLSGLQGRDMALAAVEKRNLVPLQIRQLPEAKHLFTHVEWQMTGYEIRVAEFAEPEMQPEEAGDTWFLAEIAKIEQTYPVPSAYRTYASHLQMKLGAGAKRSTRA